MTLTTSPAPSIPKNLPFQDRVLRSRALTTSTVRWGGGVIDNIRLLHWLLSEHVGFRGPMTTLQIESPYCIQAKLNFFPFRSFVVPATSLRSCMLLECCRCLQWFAIVNFGKFGALLSNFAYATPNSRVHLECSSELTALTIRWLRWPFSRPVQWSTEKEDCQSTVLRLSQIWHL